MPYVPPPTVTAKGKKVAADAATKKASAKHNKATPVLSNPINPIGRITKGKGVVVKSGGVPIATLNVRAMQQHLRQEGYDIAVDGKLGPVTKAALADYMNPKNVGDTLAQAMPGTRFTGARNPKAFNVKYGQHPAHAFKPVAKLLDKHGNDPTSTAPVANPDAGGGNGGGAGGNVVAPSMGPGFTMTPESAALLGGSLLDPNMADKLAGLQFDSQIHDLGVQQGRQPRIAAQDLADIKNWYGQAEGSLATAGARDKATSTAGRNSILDATKALVASIGGSANEGSGSVAAAGDDAVGTIGALGTAEDQYNSDMGPIMKLAQAGASASEQARQTQAAQDLTTQLEDAKGQRGDAKAQALMQILQANNATKDTRLTNMLGIRAANNQLTEQQYQNQLAEQQAQLSGLALGVKMTAANTAAARANAAINKPKPGTYGATSASVKSTAAANARAGIVDPTTGKLNVTIPAAVARVNQAIRSYGWSLANPAVLTFRNNVLQSAGITPNPAWR